MIHDIGKILLFQRLPHEGDPVMAKVSQVKVLKSIPWDFVLIVQMPQMNGFVDTRVIRGPESSVLRHDIPVIAMTAMP